MKKFLALCLSLCMLISFIPTVSVFADEQEVEITVGETKTVDIDYSISVKFTPTVPGIYSLTSTSLYTDSSCTYDKNNPPIEEIKYEKDINSWTGNKNFLLICRLEAGKTYYFEVDCWYSKTIDLLITLDKSDCSHNNTVKESASTPTCTEDGATERMYCNDCNMYISGQIIPAHHSDSNGDGICDTCSEKTNATHSGTCGYPLYWAFYEDRGLLVVSGAATMSHYDTTVSTPPWGKFRSEITNVVIDDDVLSIGAYAFEECFNLKNVYIGSSVDFIAQNAFYRCINLVSMEIPNNVTFIGDYAFAECMKLVNATIPDSVTSIGSNTFSGTALCEDTKNKEDGVLYIGKHLITADKNSISDEITIKDGTKVIASSAFNGCENLENITIPDSVTSLGDNAFYNTAFYKDTTNWEDGVLYIGKHLITADKNSISDEITVKDGTEVIAANAFQNLSDLKKITLPSTLTHIGLYAFSSSGLEELTIPDSVLYVEDGAFSECSNLKSITFSNPNTAIFDSSDVIPSGTVICGYENSTAAAHADKYKMTFEIYCEHKNTTNSQKEDATCTTVGYEVGVYCNDCKNWISGHEEISPLGHSDNNDDDICDRCTQNLVLEITSESTLTFGVANGETVYIKFVPTVTGYYSLNSDSNYSTCGFLCNENKVPLIYDNSDGNEQNFSISYYFETGTKYYFGVRYCSESDFGNVTLSLAFNAEEEESSTQEPTTQEPATDEDESDKSISDYQVNDIIEFGWYPQSKVTDNSIINELNALAEDDNTWTSYTYYSGTGDWGDGQMVTENRMRYTDVVYDSNKYRGVIIDSYRPEYTGYTSSDGTYQDDNGYSTNTVYWFLYEPIKWRVLDPTTGMVMSETILDSQAYNNYIIEGDAEAKKTGDDENEYYGNADKTYYANNYAESSIRHWLNTNFYNTAFSSSQQDIIAYTILDNSAYSENYSQYDADNTMDKIYLMSLSDVKTASYGFDNNSTRCAQGSDYAKSQGLRVWTIGKYKGNSYWHLRSAGGKSYNICEVDYIGYTNNDDDYNAGHTYVGVRPAFNFNPESGIFQSDVEDTGKSTANGAHSSHTGGTATCKTLAVCQNCGLSYGELNSSNHENVVTDEAVDATCTKTGLTEGSHCTACDAVIVEQTVISKLPHSEETLDAIEATCTKTGLTEGKKCTVCGAILIAQTKTNELGHDEVNHTAQDATCTVAGNEAYITCSRCDYTTYKELAALGHNYSSEWTIDKTPSVTSDGSKSHHCTRCDSKTDVTVITSTTDDTPNSTIGKNDDKNENKTDNKPNEAPNIPSAVDFMLGDVDGDENISAADARLALRASVGLESYNEGTKEFIAADVDKDGIISAADARLILRASVGLEALDT